VLESKIEQARMSNVSEEPRIGCLLIEWGKLTEQDVDCILFRQRSKYYLFGEIAKSMKLATDADIQAALEHQHRHGRSADGMGPWPAELVMARPTETTSADMFRDLRLQLTQNWFSRGNKALAFVSTDEKIGTSLFIANLALTFGQSKQSTLLIDANLRHPSQHEIFNLSAENGLVDIMSRSELAHFIPSQTMFRYLSVLKAGKTTSTSFELLSGGQFPTLIKRLSSAFDITLIDLPSLNLGVDALDVAAQVGGAVLVARTNQTRIAEISTAEKKLKHLGARVVGSILIDM